MQLCLKNNKILGKESRNVQVMDLQQNILSFIDEYKRILFIVTSALLVLCWLNTSSLVFRPDSVDAVRRWVSGFGVFGPLVYIALYAVRPFLFFPSLLLNMSAGLLFGPWWGILYLILGGLANASVCFWLARLLGSSQSLLKRFGGRWGERLDGYLSDDRSFIRMFWLRTVPIFPYDPVSIMAGSSSMKYLPYAAATVVGMLPGAIAYNFLADSFVSRTVGMSAAVLIAVIAFGIPLIWWFVSDEHKRL